MSRSYFSYVLPSTRTVDASRAIIGGALTSLHEVVAPRISSLPSDIARQLARDFWKRHEATTDWAGKYEAQEWLAREVQTFERERVGLAFDEHEIRERAKRWSELCGKMQRLEVMQDFARSVGIDPPEVKKSVTRVSAARRLACPRWWRRQIRKHYTRRAESHLRAAGFVHRRRQVYASDRAVSHRAQRKAKDRALLGELLAVSDAGDQLELWDIVQKSQANPALRRAELMTRLRGFEEVAQAAGHVAEFVTLTCPSAFHRTHDNGTRNERWEGYSPREGQAWLCKMWARARAKLKRLSIHWYGFRIAEPHHDGTPHWHAVLFVPRHQAETLRAVLRGVWLSEYEHEPGAQKYRCKVIRIDQAKGSACGYVAKYVAKNIDGYEVGDDYEAGADAAETCDRVAAWASAHGIRQFQQIGGPPVTVWRELRRLRAEVRDFPAIEAARKAADAGEWAEFIAATRRAAIGLWREHTGELNAYDELRAPQIAGVEAYTREGAVPVVKATGDGRLATGGTGEDRPAAPITRARQQCAESRGANTCIERVRTRSKVWRIERKGDASLRQAAVNGACDGRSRPCSHSSLGPVSITVRGTIFVPIDERTRAAALSRSRGDPWTH